MNKLQKTEADIVDLITKWYSHKVVFPKGWSDERFLSGAPISYKTYDSGNISYINIELTIDYEKYDINLRSGTVYINAPITRQLGVVKVLDILTDIYEESTSIKSMVEGQASLREKIANQKKQLKSTINSIKELEGQLQ